MAKYEKYAEYKDSGVEWLGEIPSHWTFTSLKRFSFVKGGYAFSSDIFTSVGKPIIRIGDIQADGSISLDNCKNIPLLVAENSQDYLVTKGQILMAMTGATIGKAGIFDSDEVAYLNQRVGKFIIDSNALDYGYLWYLLKTHGYQEYIRLTAFGGAQPNISDTAMVDFNTCIPSLSEQVAIANFLDHETAKIDSLIFKQEKLIELLKEKRQAVISHAVTKGLNPDVNMKDSGVEWLGQVPEHWAVAKLAYRYEVLLGKMLDESKITGNYLGKYLRNTDVQWGKINCENLPEMDFRPHEVERYSVKQGDLLVCEGGEIGRCAIWESEDTCFYQKALHRLRAYSDEDSHKFMFYVLFDSVHRERFISGAGKATIAHLPAETFKQYRFAFPPKIEQDQIVEYLDKMSKAFDGIELKALEQIDLLKERRTALISSAVTGKIDVRHHASRPTGNDKKQMEDI